MRKILIDISANKPKASLLFCLWGLLLFVPLYGLSSTPALAQYSISMEKMPLGEALKEIESSTSFNILYNSNDVENIESSAVNIKDASIKELMEGCLSGTNLGFDIDGMQVVVYKQEEPDAPKSTRLITGVVKDSSTGMTIPGAYVISTQAGKSLTGTTTNEKGRFDLRLSNEADGLSVSFVGYKTKTVELKGNVNFTILLESDMQVIDDVVVTGIFNKAKESYTGAATFISKKELVEFESRDMLRTISNIDPAFNVVMNEGIGSDPNRLPEINIRGASSISTQVTSANEDDFENLRDSERVNLNTPLFILDGFEITLQRMMDLNQDEIESVTILKDASATAIYGSQGANGVVVLTSIKPKVGKLTVDYRGTFNVEVPDLRSYNLMDAAGKLQLEKDAGLYETDDFSQQESLKRSYNDKLKSIREGTDTYWLSKPVQVGLGQRHSVNLGGGDPAFRYRMNFQFRNTQGAMKGSVRDNFNGTINISYIFKNLQFTNILMLGFNESNNSQYGAFSSYALLNPYWRLYDDEGQMYQQFGTNDPMMTPVNNPLYNASLGGYDKNRYTNINENFRLDWTISEGFKVSARLGYSKNSSVGDRFTPPNHTEFIGKEDNLRGKYVFSTSESSTLNSQLTLNYAKVIDKHRIYLGLNGQIRETNSVSYGMIVTGFPHDRMDFISMGSQYSGNTPYGAESMSRSVGVTSNLNYTFNNCYYADLSYRLDGASSFGKNSRFAPFYSLGVGWNVNRMQFFQDNFKSISSLRLRYSYGVTGSLQFSPYDAMTTYSYLVGDDRYDGNLGTTIRKIGNPNLKWQTTYQHNIGFDLTMWDSRFSLAGNYYHKKTEDLITQVNIPLSNGYTSYIENMGDVLNQGFELNASVNILKQTKNTPGWSVRGSVSHNRNTLLRISSRMNEINSQNEANSDNLAPVYLYREGESMNALYVVPSLGIDPATGREMFVNADGNATYDYPAYNKVPVGLMQPKINGRLSTNLSYKNLRLSVGFTFRLGASVYNSTLASRVETNDLTKNVDQRVYTDRWRAPGDISSYKGLQNEEATLMSSRFVQTERALILNSLTLDYMVPRAWVKKNLKMSRLNLSYSTNDLIYLSTVRRERGTGYPFAWRHNLSLVMGI